MLVHMLCWCPSTRVVRLAVSAAAASQVGLSPAAAPLPGSVLSLVKAHGQSRSPRAAPGQRRALSRRALGAAEQRTIKDPFLFSSMEMK